VGLSWVLGLETVTLYAKAKTAGGVSLGFQDPDKKGGWMIGAEGVMGYLDTDGQVSITGYQMVGYAVADMLRLPVQTHLTDTRVTAEDGYITMAFTYPLAATFEGGLVVNPSQTGLIWSLQDVAGLVKHTLRGQSILNLVSGDSTLTVIAETLAHWWLVTVFFVIFLAGGLLVTHTPLKAVPVLRRCLNRRVGKPVTVGEGWLKSPVMVAREYVQDLTQVQLGVLLAFLVLLVGFVAIPQVLEGGGGLLMTRNMGWLNTLLMGLVTLPASRTSVWVWFFGISFERAVHFHQTVARLAWLTILIHLIVAMNVLGATIPISAALSGEVVPLYGFLAFLAVTATALSAMNPIRRRLFEVFYHLHLMLLPVVYIMSALHVNSSLHRWVLLSPLSVYVIDRALRFSRRRNTATVVEAKAMRAGQGQASALFLKLQMKTSLGHEAGDYVFLNCPEVDLLQWHPFTISSAPGDAGEKGQDGTITFHILSMGPDTWTGKLQALLTAPGPPPVINVDGPLGSLQVDLAGGIYGTALMVSGGVGITPMASLLSDILHRDQGGYPGLARVAFCWVVRDQEQLAWFEPLLARARAHQGAITVDLFLYCTRGKEESNAYRVGRPDWPGLVREMLGGGKQASGMELGAIKVATNCEAQTSASKGGAQGGACMLACGPGGLVAAAQEQVR
jgi:predicted ferric reductase